MRALLLSAAAAAAGAAMALWSSAGDVRAQSLPTTLAISGLHVDGVKREATVSLTNASRDGADFYAITVFFFHADGNAAANPMLLPQPLLAGRTVVVDVAGAVNAHRAGFGVGPFRGPIQVLVSGTSCLETETCPPGAVPRPFGPEVIQAAARQTDGAAIYDAAIVWHVAP